MKKMICAIIALVTLGSTALADGKVGTSQGGTVHADGARAIWAG